MKNENEDIRNLGTENKKMPKHNTWIENIEEEINDLDIKFPLSGNEDGKPHVLHHHDHTETNDKEPRHNTSWIGNIIDKIQDLDVDFPLSGGDE